MFSFIIFMFFINIFMLFINNFMFMFTSAISYSVTIRVERGIEVIDI